VIPAYRPRERRPTTGATMGGDPDTHRSLDATPNCCSDRRIALQPAAVRAFDRRPAEYETAAVVLPGW